MMGLILALSFTVFLNNVPFRRETLFFRFGFFNITERDVNIFFRACQALLFYFSVLFVLFLKKLRQQNPPYKSTTYEVLF